LTDFAALLAIELHVTRIFYALAYCSPKGAILVFVTTTCRKNQEREKKENGIQGQILAGARTI